MKLNPVTMDDLKKGEKNGKLNEKKNEEKIKSEDEEMQIETTKNGDEVIFFLIKFYFLFL